MICVSFNPPVACKALSSLNQYHVATFHVPDAGSISSIAVASKFFPLQDRIEMPKQKNPFTLRTFCFSDQMSSSLYIGGHRYPFHDHPDRFQFLRKQHPNVFYPS